MVESLDLLRKVREGKKVRITDTVAVIGGGTAALDAARTARRLGAKSVTVLAPRDAAHLEAGARDLAAALDEGVKVEFDVAAKKVKAGKTGRPAAVECVRLGRSKGRTREIKDSRFEVAGDDRDLGRLATCPTSATPTKRSRSRPGTRSRPTTTPAAPRRPACSPPATPSAAPAR